MSKPVYARIGRTKKRRSNRRLGRNQNIYVNQTSPSTMVCDYSYTVKETNWSPELPVTGTFSQKGIMSVFRDYKEVGGVVFPPFRLIDPGAPYKPVLWRQPKKYTRFQYSLKLSQPSVTIVSQSDSIKDLYIDTPILPALPEERGIYDLFRGSPSSSDLQLHYLAFNQRLADQKVDVLTTVAEAKSTITMIANAATDLFDLYRYVRRGNLRKAKRIMSARGIKTKVSKHWKNKTAENRWLEFTYGWAPLLGDIKTAFEELTAEREATLPIIKVVYSTKAGDNFDPIGVLLTPGERWSGTAVYKTACYFSVANPNVREAAKWNLGNNPLLTAWELVPYSFIVDWFIPIGDFLTQFSAAQGLDFISGTSVLYAKGVASGTYSYQFRSGSDFSAQLDVPYHRSMFITDRIVHDTRPIGLPVFTFGLNARRAVNALALVSQRR
ncbi:MAG: putative maturation protein [Herbuvirus faecivivens]|uniref:Maturation protein n=1 Tax=Leviviridae sp. TaxID=2027243 RepID=A0ABY3STX7_9VIRU|nr:MAG: putative maturation protein [Leviviridae sp.]